MLTCCDCSARPVIMKGRRKRNVHCVNIFGFQQRFIGSKAVLNAMARSEFLGFSRRSGRDSRHFDTRYFLGRCQKRVRHHPCCPQHAKTNHGAAPKISKTRERALVLAGEATLPKPRYIVEKQASLPE